jgi:hypothetical protein
MRPPLQRFDPQKAHPAAVFCEKAPHTAMIGPHINGKIL